MPMPMRKKTNQHDALRRSQGRLPRSDYEEIDKFIVFIMFLTLVVVGLVGWSVIRVVLHFT